ncbi:MAG: DEAD/DEAH box helicase [Polyangiaceae bacterium]|nr:DEAD/DEAH box helicase [Polyangiaceae bacterium]
MAPVTLDAAAPLASQTVSAAPSSPAMEPPLAGKRELPPGVRVGRWGARGEGGSPPPGFGAVPTLAESARRALPLPMRATAKREPFSTERWPEIDEAAKRLGIERLTTEQRHAIRALLEGRDLLVALPAGAGKTSAALVAALLTRQPTLLVSPLISAQRDLHDRLHARRAPVVRVDPGIFGEERKRALARFTATEPLVVLTTPESLSSDDLTSALARSGIGFVAVEDAECTSEWAHEYRPAHAELGRALERLGSPQVAALCAPSVAAVRHDVAERLALRAPLVLAGDPVRANLALDATEARGEVRQRTLVSLVMRLERPGIVYCATPREVDAVHGALRALRVPVHRYHGELPAGERAGEQLNFLLPGRRAVMVATSGFAPSTGFAGLGELGRLELTPAGFGRGLEKRDTRFVIHYQAPASLEQYLRELGAAGRDGKPASAILLYDPADRGYHDAALARARLRPAHVLELARALESSALDGRAASLESLALATRQSRRNAELVAAVLADAGLVDLAPGWARAAVAGVELFERARRVAGALETLAREDGRRLDAVAAYARSAGCRTLHLGRYLGMSDTVECGRCSACDAAAFDGRRFAPLTEPAPGRRAAPRSFEVTRLDVSRPSSAPLTAKLGEFVG